MKNNIFQKARIKLTIYYVAIMMAILALFSSVLIYTVELKIRQGFKDRVIVTEVEGDPVQNTSDDIEMLIYLVDGVLLIIIGFSSYFLAGKTLKPIKEALDAQKKFSADASHDLRTPLAIMMTESEVALQNKSPRVDELQSTIGSNLEEAKKMSKLVNDLLLISRGEQENTLNNFIITDLHSFTEKVMQKFTRQAKDKNLTLEISEYIKRDILLEPSSFERAISNLIQNAINYTKQGGVKIEIGEDVKNIILSIRDSGVGISSADLPFIFDRFYKAEHSRNDQSGSGLGLSIAKQIIKKHNGDISVESNVGTGTVVTIKIVKL
jgi:signal transduction histidine kinase